MHQYDTARDYHKEKPEKKVQGLAGSWKLNITILQKDVLCLLVAEGRQAQLWLEVSSAKKFKFISTISADQLQIKNIEIQPLKMWFAFIN
jgi:hypothetical protein